MSTIVHPLQEIRGADNAAADAFKGLRAAIDAAGPLDETVRELILLAGFVPLESEAAIKIHAGRLLDAGLALQAVRQAVMIPLGATACMTQVSRALAWVSEVDAARRTDGAAA